MLKPLSASLLSLGLLSGCISHSEPTANLAGHWQAEYCHQNALNLCRFTLVKLSATPERDWQAEACQSENRQYQCAFTFKRQHHQGYRYRMEFPPVHNSTYARRPRPSLFRITALTQSGLTEHHYYYLSGSLSYTDSNTPDLTLAENKNIRIFSDRKLAMDGMVFVRH